MRFFSVHDLFTLITRVNKNDLKNPVKQPLYITSDAINNLERFHTWTAVFDHITFGVIIMARLFALILFLSECSVTSCKNLDKIEILSH